jgi:hypothetical protein
VAVITVPVAVTVAVVPIAATLVAIAVVAAMIVIWTSARVVERDADRPAAEILAVQIFDSAVGVLSREVLENSLVTEVPVNISEGDASSLASKVLEILPACVT